MGNSFRGSKEWKIDIMAGERFSSIVEQPEGNRLTSLSGYERNVLFLNQRGKQFTDVSRISGADNIADCRTFVYWDYDRDGWLDMAVVNSNSPLLSIYHNDIGQSEKEDYGNMIGLRLVGGNRSSEPSHTQACRDGYGAKVRVDLSDMTLVREHRCGEGFAGQNSATMVIGIGSHREARLVEVRWPSGQTQEISNVTSGTLLTVYQDAAESPDGSGFLSQPYRSPGASTSVVAKYARVDESMNLDLPGSSSSSRLRMYTTMATWCASCKKQIPQLAFLKSQFDNQELVMYGVPVDRSDDLEKLEQYRSTYDPAYELLTGLSASHRSQIKRILDKTTPLEALPSSIIIDAAGRVLKSFVGVPTSSELKKLLSNDSL